MKHIFIVNPVAGKMNVEEKINKINDSCQQNNLQYEIKITTSIGDAARIACTYATLNEDYVIYSVGGDGTLNEVVNGMANSNATLGVIPSGSGNDFFRMLSNNKEDILNRTINGNIDNINIGKVNNSHFINIASVGYDAEAAANASLMKQKKIIPNSMIYYASVFYTLLSFKSPKIKMTFNDMGIEQQIMLLAICNGAYYGNGIPIAPSADCHDDLLNICLVDKISKARIPYLLTEVVKGVHEKYDFVHTYQTDYIKIEAESPLHCNVDGEIITSDNLEFGIIKNKMKVLKPKKTTI